MKLDIAEGHKVICFAHSDLQNEDHPYTKLRESCVYVEYYCNFKYSNLKIQRYEESFAFIIH